MARLRLRVELNKGRTGVPLEKFASIVAELKEFVEQLGVHSGIPPEKNIWFAHEFANGSALFTNELNAVAEVASRARFNGDVRYLTTASKSENEAPRLPPSLIDQFTKVTGLLDIGEPISFGIFNSDDDANPTEWFPATKLGAQAAFEDIETESRYVGSILGSIHSLNKGSTPPFLNVRDIVAGELVKCYYTKDQYPSIAKILQKEDALVYVRGLITVSLVRGRVDHLDADQFEIAPEHKDGDLAAFIGSCPGITGGLTTKQYISKIRSDGGRT